MSNVAVLDNTDAVYKMVDKELKSARAMRRFAKKQEYSSRDVQVANDAYWEGQIDAWLWIRALFPKPIKAASGVKSK